MSPGSDTSADCIFCAILNGREPAVVVARDDQQQLALIKSIHPESSIHWMAVPTQHVDSIEALKSANQEQFVRLVDYAIAQARELAADYPTLERGFTLKMHFGSYETIPHAKVHILGME